MNPRVVIVGGGISGLSTAFYLQQRGIASTICEASGRLGGLIRTDHLWGSELEAGPDSFLATKPAVAEIAQDLGIADLLMGSNDEQRRVFVVRHGELTPMPAGMVMMVPSQWKAIAQSDLVGPGSKRQFLREVRTKPRVRTGDVSVRDFVLDHFDTEALEYLTEPLLAGVYGGRAADLSARSVLPRFVEYEEKFGSLIRGVRATQKQTQSPKSAFLSFAGGMQVLVDALRSAIADQVDVRFQAVRSLERQGQTWRVGTEGETLEADHVVLACPAFGAAALLQAGFPALSACLEQIVYSSSILATFVFKKQTFDGPSDGFGFLVPDPERRLISAATWIHTKFPSRMAEGSVAIRAFLVDPEAERYGRMRDEDLLKLVLGDLQRIMRFRTLPMHSKVDRWPQSMPQYRVGHGKLVSDLQSELNNVSGLSLTSNYLDGIGIPDCVRQAKLAAFGIFGK